MIIVKRDTTSGRDRKMKASYETVIKYMDDYHYPINEYVLSNGESYMEICGRSLTNKAREELNKNDYLVDVINTELDITPIRLGLVHVWVRGR